MVTDLMADFTIGAAILGTLTSLYFYPYVIMQFFLGALIDRLGPRILLTGAILIGAVGSILFGSAETVTLAYIGRALIGIGSAVGFLSTLALAAKWFPPERFAFLSGLVMFFGMMSGVFASAPLAFFIENFGWRTAMWSLAVFSFVLASIIFIFVRNAPEETNTSETPLPLETWKEMWSGLARAARTLEVWKVAMVASTMSGPMLALGTLWATPYLISAYELPASSAAFLVSLLLMGWAFGAPFFGWLSDRIKKRKALLVINSAIQTLALIILVFIPAKPLWLVVSLFIIIGVSGASMAVTFALAREGNPKSISGSVTGIVNAMTVASGALLQPVVGILLDWSWGGEMSDGAAVYSAQNYETAFIVILGSTAVGFLISLTLKETKFA